jgi:hypothetical protein
VCSTTLTGFVLDRQGTLVAERVGADEYYYVFDGLGSVVATPAGSGHRGGSAVVGMRTLMFLLFGLVGVLPVAQGIADVAE